VVGKEVLAAGGGVIPGGEPGAAPEDTGPLPKVAPDDAGSLARSAALMSVGTALSRVTGFLRISAMAFALGVTESRLADAYNVANITPNIIYELALGGILSSVFVPIFVEQITSRTKEQAWHVARAVLTSTIVLLGIVMIAGILLAPWIVRIYSFRIPDPGERAAAEALATLFLRFFMPQILFYGIGAAATGLLNAHRRFVVPMFAPILNNLVVIASFLIFAAIPLPVGEIPLPETITLAHKLVLAIGTTAGVLAMTVALWPALRGIGFRFRWAFDIRHPAIRKLIRLSGWAVGYVVVNQIGLLIVIALAARDQGAYTAYQAAFIFFQLPHAIFSVSIMTALLPSMSQRWVEGDAPGFRRIIARGIRASAFVVVPAAAGYMVLARPIVRLLLEHGVTTAESTELLAGVLVYFALGLFSFSAFMLFLRGFYAMQDTRTPMLVNLAAVSVNTAANLALFPVLGVRGLALGHTIAYTFAAVVSALILRRRLGGLEGAALGRGLSRIVAGAVLTGAAAWGAAWFMSGLVATDTFWGQLIEVGTGVAAGGIIFIGAALLFRMEEFDLVKTSILRLRR
jgi:putative peptidoglycan lipid II flippase